MAIFNGSHQWFNTTKLNYFSLVCTISERFRVRMEEYLTASDTNTIFTDDLKTIVHVAETQDDLDTAVKMIKRCGLVIPYMVTKICVNIGSGNGLLPDSTKPFPEPMLADHQWSPVTFIWMAFTRGQFQKKCSRYLSLILVWKLLLEDYSHISQEPMIKMTAS